MKRLGLALGSLGLGLLSGCASLPDLQLAKQAKSEGDLATAEANFRGLAGQGYVDGEIGLADILVRSPSPERQAQAEESIDQDEFVREAVALFDAKVVEDTTRPF